MIDNSHIVSLGSKSKYILYTHSFKGNNCALIEHLRMIIALSHLTEMS